MRKNLMYADFLALDPAFLRHVRTIRKDPQRNEIEAHNQAVEQKKRDRLARRNAKRMGAETT